MSPIVRPNCQSPAACLAKGKGHCRKCHMAAMVRKLHADPEFAAAHAERMRKLNADPEFAAALKAGQRGGVVVPPDKEADWRTLKKAGYSVAEAAKAMGLKP